MVWLILTLLTLQLLAYCYFEVSSSARRPNKLLFHTHGTLTNSHYFFKGEVQDFFKISQITQFCPLIHVRYVLRDHASPLPSNRPSKFLGGGACPPKFSGGGACPPMRQTAPHAPLIDPSRPVPSCDSTDTSRTSLHAIALHVAVDTVHWCMSCRLTIAFAHYHNPSQRMDVNSTVRSKQTTSETPLSLIW